MVEVTHGHREAVARAVFPTVKRELKLSVERTGGLSRLFLYKIYTTCPMVTYEASPALGSFAKCMSLLLAAFSIGRTLVGHF